MPSSAVGCSNQREAEIRVLLAADAATDTIVQSDPHLEASWGLPGGLRGMSLSKLFEAETPCEALLRHTLGEFVYTATHDLKSPMRHLALMVNMLRADLKDTCPEGSRDLLDGIERAAHKAMHLLQRLQVYAETVTETPEVQPEVDLGEVIRRALDAARLDADTGTITGNVPDLHGTVIADPARLELVFVQLFNNAVQYRGKQRLSVSVVAERVGPDWKISVADNGLGIEAQDADRLFRPFRRLHSERISGSGFGLAICQAAMVQQAGSIRFDASHRPGARFVVKIPASTHQH